MQCSQCRKTNSPTQARFCVDCGYALRQACPYNCGFMALDVQVGAPAPQCPQCARFLAYCPDCLRLRPLGARDCPTPRCARANVMPQEPFAFHDGRAGGAPVALQTPWHYAKPTPLEPKAQSPSAQQRCGGLASRYGKVAWWKEEKLHLWDAPKPDGFWPTGNPQTVAAIAPLSRSGGIFPEREALLLKHGFAYLLGQNATARIAIGGAGASKATLSLRDAESDTTGDTGGVAASGAEIEWTIAGDDSPPTGAASWQPHEVSWIAQNATDDRWFALGSIGSGLDETLVGATVLGSDPLFEGGRWQLPPGVDLKDWQELLAWDGAPLLRCERAIWREQKGQWSKIFELAPDEFSLDGALVCEPYLWIWGQEKGRLWVERLDAGQTRDPSSRSRPSLPFAPGDRLMSVPTASGSRITFWLDGAQHGAATLDMERPLDEVGFQQLPGATEVLWAASATHDQSQWLLYALDDGELVRFFLVQQSPAETQPLQLMQFRPFRDGYDATKGATLAATISGDCLVVSYIGSVRGQPGVWLMAYAWR